MIDPVRAAAERSVSRGCGLAVLPIWLAMTALVADPAAALQTGAVLVTLAAAVLFAQAVCAQRRSYKRTRTWLSLSDAERPVPAVAQRVIPSVLREILMRYARVATVLAAGLWAITGVLTLG